MSTEIAVLEADDAKSLQLAHDLMENPGLVARLSDMIGQPIEAAVEMLPESAQKLVGDAVEKAVNAVLQVALKTMDAAPAEAKPESKKSGWWQKATSAANSAVGSVFGAGDDDAVTEGAPPKASNLLHQVASAATGAVGGAFGLAGMPIERKR